MSALRVTVFGGSQPIPGDPAYQDALQLGAALGGAGYTVLTGGYIGTMEAVSRGAAESGGHVIGVTCDEIERWRPVGPNPWIQEEWRYATLQDRLHALIKNCDAALALPGGIGTLAEIAVMWSNLQTGVLTARPLILIGAGWQATLNQLFSSLDIYIPPEDKNLLTFSLDITAAVHELSTHLSGG